MKVKTAIRTICKHCKIVKKDNVLYVRCIANGRHKQRQCFSTLNVLNSRLNDSNEIKNDLNKIQKNYTICYDKTDLYTLRNTLI